jgi:hypothetical protein
MPLHCAGRARCNAPVARANNSHMHILGFIFVDKSANEVTSEPRLNIYRPLGHYAIMQKVAPGYTRRYVGYLRRYTGIRKQTYTE